AGAAQEAGEPRRGGRGDAPRPRGPRDHHPGDRRLHDGPPARARPGGLRTLRLGLPPLRGHRRLHGRLEGAHPAAAAAEGGLSPRAGRYPSLPRISRFQWEIDRLFGEAMAMGEENLPGLEWQPEIDLVETPDAVLLLAEVPGVAAADLKVEVKGMR